MPFVIASEDLLVIQRKIIALIALMVEVLFMPFYLISDPSIHLTIFSSSSITFVNFSFFLSRLWLISLEREAQALK